MFGSRAYSRPPSKKECSTLHPWLLQFRLGDPWLVTGALTRGISVSLLRRSFLLPSALWVVWQRWPQRSGYHKAKTGEKETSFLPPAAGGRSPLDRKNSASQQRAVWLCNDAQQCVSRAVACMWCAVHRWKPGESAIGLPCRRSNTLDAAEANQESASQTGRPVYHFERSPTCCLSFHEAPGPRRAGTAVDRDALLPLRSFPAAMARSKSGMGKCSPPVH